MGLIAHRAGCSVESAGAVWWQPSLPSIVPCPSTSVVSALPTSRAHRAEHGAGCAAEPAQKRFGEAVEARRAGHNNPLPSRYSRICTCASSSASSWAAASSASLIS